MTDLAEIRSIPCRPSDSIRQVDEPSELACVFEPQTQIVRLSRRPDAAIEHELGTALRAGSLGSGGRVVLAVGAAPDAAALPGLTFCPVLRADIGRLIELYADLMECSSVGLRLEVVDRAMCPRFHVDRVALRLLVTYRGPATQWLDDAAADRSRLGAAAGELPDAQSGLIRDPGAVGGARPFDIILLKGCQWPGNEARGAIHRSPAVPAEHAPRVLVALDAVWP
jgi:hypothetical protein